jgi:hypothetical protein
MAETDKAKRQRRMNRWFPTNKWWGQFIVSDATIAGMLWTGNGVDTDAEKLALIGIVANLATTYLIPNNRRVL